MLPVQFDKAKCFRKSHHKAKPRKQIARLACVQSQDQLLTQLRVAGRVAVCAMAIWVEIPKHNGGLFEKWGKSPEKKGVTSPLNSHQRAQLKNGLPVQAAAPRNRRRGGVFSSRRCSGGSGAVPDSPRSGIWMNNERICQTFSKYYKLSIKHGVENWAICLSYHGL
jgi:hypothetical protein